MATESFCHLSGTVAPTLSVTVSCPKCGGVMTFLNGSRVVIEGVGTSTVALVNCPKCHLTYEIRARLARSHTAEPANYARNEDRPSRAKRVAPGATVSR